MHNINYFHSKLSPIPSKPLKQFLRKKDSENGNLLQRNAVYCSNKATSL
jgi:hypothetical protein